MFNRHLSEWDVSSVTDMDEMFLNAVSFKQTLCGATWVNSKASKKQMFEGSSGSIAETALPEFIEISHQSIPERELIVRTPISTPSVTSTIDRTITCPRCGTFRKSDRVSCCAPGGAWFKNCGGLSSKGVDHKWSDGVSACKCKFKAKSM